MKLHVQACPECKKDIVFDRKPDKGAEFKCPNCNAVFGVNTKPVEKSSDRKTKSKE